MAYEPEASAGTSGGTSDVASNDSEADLAQVVVVVAAEDSDADPAHDEDSTLMEEDQMRFPVEDFAGNRLAEVGRMKTAAEEQPPAQALVASAFVVILHPQPRISGLTPILSMLDIIRGQAGSYLYSYVEAPNIFQNLFAVKVFGRIQWSPSPRIGKNSFRCHSCGY